MDYEKTLEAEVLVDKMERLVVRRQGLELAHERVRTERAVLVDEYNRLATRHNHSTQAEGRRRHRAALDRRSPKLGRPKDELDETTRKIDELDAEIRLLYGHFLAAAGAHPLAIKYELSW